MNKLTVELIVGFIKDKGERGRWRRILRHGFFRYVKLKYGMIKRKTRPSYYLSVCVIAKNEGPYFKEWLDWHISQGVEKFYIYDNESTDSTVDVLRPYVEKGIVEYRYFPGIRKQLAAYDDCLRKHRLDTRWLAFLDMDEFIVPIKDSDVVAFLKRMESHSAVEINWLVYGSGGAITKEEGGQMERFKKHSESDHVLNRHVKSIVDPTRIYTMIGCHEAACVRGKGVDSHGNEVKIAWPDREPQHDVIRINHYAVRSLEEYRSKQRRGRARSKGGLNEDYFRRFDLNDIEDP